MSNFPWQRMKWKIQVKKEQNSMKSSSYSRFSKCETSMTTFHCTEPQYSLSFKITDSKLMSVIKSTYLMGSRSVGHQCCTRSQSKTTEVKIVFILNLKTTWLFQLPGLSVHLPQSVVRPLLSIHKRNPNF